MRAVSPDFEIDDRALVGHRVSRSDAMKAAAKSRVRPTAANRGRHYWATVAAAYDRGLQRGRTVVDNGGLADG
jgi:hypothetical protein